MGNAINIGGLGGVEIATGSFTPTKSSKVYPNVPTGKNKYPKLVIVKAETTPTETSSIAYQQMVVNEDAHLGNLNGKTYATNYKFLSGNWGACSMNWNDTMGVTETAINFGTGYNSNKYEAGITYNWTAYYWD